MGQGLRPLVLLGVAAAFVVGLASAAGGMCTRSETCAAAPSRMATGMPKKSLLGILRQSANSPAVLARLDPLSLRTVSRQVEVGEYHDAWSLSPDASQLALARGGQGIGIEIVDLKAMRLVRDVQTGIASEALGWLGPRLVVAALQRGGTVLVDPLTGRILRRWPSFSFPDASARTRDGLVMLLPQLRKSGPGLPLTRVAGPPRLAVVDARGRLRSVTLERIRLAVRSRNGTYYYGDRAGFAVDPARARAYVFAADAPVAQVDLRTMRVSYHRLEPLFLRPGKLKSANGSKKAVLARERGALWLGDGDVVVFGRDFVTARGKKDTLVPAGAMLVNTANWSWRTLDTQVTGAEFAAGKLVVYGPGWYQAGGLGLTTYTLGGRRISYLLQRERVFDVQIAADWAYVRTPNGVYVVDVRAGKVVTRIAPPRELVDVIVGSS